MSGTYTPANVPVSTHHYHLIPANSNDKQTIFPISREHLSTDQVVLYPVGIESEPDQLKDIADILRDMLGHETTVAERLETAQDAYTTAYEQIRNYLNKEGDVKLWVNVAGATGACSTAFSQAATALQIEEPECRPDITVYTVAEDGTPEPMGCAPSGKPTDIGKTILSSLLNEATPESITALARQMSDEKLTPAYRSKIQYNVKKLEKQGYVERRGNNQMRPLLTPTGKMWAQTHSQS